jgi:uridine kinase
MKNRTLNIVISGPCASGKTSFARALQILCNEYNIPFTLNDDDIDVNREFDTDEESDRLKRVFTALGESGKVTVNIKTVQTHHEP